MPQGLWKGTKEIAKQAHQVVSGLGFKIKPWEQLEKETKEKQEIEKK